MLPDPRQQLRTARRIVLKVGSAVLAPGGELDVKSLRSLCGQISQLACEKREVVVVSSGAVASGFRALGLNASPKTIRLKQAAAAIGQQRLIARYAGELEKEGLVVAQVLLTAEDFESRSRFLNARHTLETLVEHRIIPIINENDSVSFDEIKLGDNDKLSALTAAMLRADLLVMLSSAPGVSASASRPGEVVPRFDRVEDARRFVRSDKSAVGTGGMSTKLDAAEIVTRVGIPAVIAPGGLARAVPRLLAGENIGTVFSAQARAPDSRRRWIGLAARARGTIAIDAGAVKALVGRGASLLPSGIVSVRGEFEQGDVVEIADASGRALAKGLTAYSSAEIAQIRGRRASDIIKILGYTHCDEVVHRDDLMLTAKEPS
ncbi:MAG: glutamate 5-kinase [Planctomycetes bacterium]|nr:glutamate 5-kinase [Planctomycetota bacterium]